MEEFLRKCVGLRLDLGGDSGLDSFNMNVPSENALKDTIIDEFLGIGASTVILSIGGFAIKIPRNTFDVCEQLDEFSLLFEKVDGTPAYNVEILNEKVAGLVGNKHVDELIPVYRDLILRGLEVLGSESEEILSSGALNAFGIPLISRSADRFLKQWKDDADVILDTELMRERLIRARQLIRNIGESGDLFANPIYVWNGIHVANYFLESEYLDVARYIYSHYKIEPWMFEQAGSVISSMWVLDYESEAKRSFNFMANLAACSNHKEVLHGALNKGVERRLREKANNNIKPTQ